MIANIANKLDSTGYPLNPTSIFIAVRREYLPTREQLIKIKPFTYPEMSLPVRNVGRWEILVGFIGRVQEFTDGVVVKFPQHMQKSLLKWPDAVLWIPNHGTAGILS